MDYKAVNFKYEYALVCRDIPKTIANGLSIEDHEPVDLNKTIQEQKDYIDYLKQAGLKLIEIDAQEIYPDCVFVEDTAIAIDNKIFISNPGAESRRGEAEAVTSKFEEHSKELGLEICQVQNKEESFVDGGDVMFTGREIIVGLSKRTNLKGAEELGAFFKDIPVITCKVFEGLHLKSSMSMISPDLILIGSSQPAQSCRQQIEKKSKFLDHYRFVNVDEDQNGSANVLSFNDRLVCSQSFQHLYSKMSDFKNATSLSNDELKKIDGCLTCRSVFFNKKS